MASNTDEYYIARSLNGHPDDFRFLVRRYQSVLMAHLIGRLGDKDRAEEAAQETLVRSYFNLAKLQKRESFFPWMLGISNMVVKEQHRKDQQQKEAVNSMPQTTTPPKVGHDYPLARTIARLPRAQRELILLRYYGDVSCKEIARQYQIPLGTVTKTLSRAYALLRDMLRQSECEVQQ